MEEDELARTLEAQDGVISRRQLLALGATKSDIDRMVRRRELARVHTGVYVHHTGPLTWRQRAPSVSRTTWRDAAGRPCARSTRVR